MNKTSQLINTFERIKLLKNNFWKPEEKIKIKVTRKNLNFDDDICPLCANVGICQNPCILLEGVNGKKERIEKLLNDDTKIDELEYKNGNEIISELMENRRMAYESISMISNVKLRLIIAGTWVGIPKEKIADLMHLSRSRIYAIMSKK